MTTAYRRLQDLPEMIVRDVAELPERSSPEDQPEMMLVTAAELDRIVTDRVAEVAPASGVTEDAIANLICDAFPCNGCGGTEDRCDGVARAIFSLIRGK